MKINNPAYGVVFEEWQGGGFLVERGLLELVPVVRSGPAHLLEHGPADAIFRSENFVLSGGQLFAPR